MDMVRNDSGSKVLNTYPQRELKSKAKLAEGSRVSTEHTLRSQSSGEKNIIENLYLQPSFTSADILCGNNYQPNYQEISGLVDNSEVLVKLNELVAEVDQVLNEYLSFVEADNQVLTTETPATTQAEGSSDESTEGYSSGIKHFNSMFMNAAVALFNFIKNNLTPQQIVAMGEITKNILDLNISFTLIMAAQGDAVVNYMEDAKKEVWESSWLQFAGAAFSTVASVAGAGISYQGQADMINATTNLDFYDLSTKTTAAKTTLNDYKTKIADNYSAGELSNLKKYFNNNNELEATAIDNQAAAIKEVNKQIKDDLLGTQALIDLKSDPVGKSTDTMRIIKEKSIDNGLLKSNGEHFDDDAMRGLLDSTAQEQNDYLNLPKIQRSDINKLSKFEDLPKSVKIRMFRATANTPKADTDKVNLISSYTKDNYEVVEFIDADANNNIYFKQIKAVTQDDGSTTYELKHQLLGTDADIANAVKAHQNNNIYLSKNIGVVKKIKLYNDSVNANSPAYQDLQGKIKEARDGAQRVSLKFNEAKLSIRENQANIVKYKDLYDRKVQSERMTNKFAAANNFSSIDELQLAELSAVNNPVLKNAITIIENPNNINKPLSNLEFSSDEIPYKVADEGDIIHQGVRFRFNDEGEAEYFNLMEDGKPPIVGQINAHIDRLETSSQEFTLQAGISSEKMNELDDFAAKLIKADSQHTNLNEHLEALSPLQIGDPMRGEKNGQYYEATMNYKKQLEKSAHFKTAVGLAASPVGLFVQKLLDVFANQMQIESQNIEKVGESSTNISQSRASALQSLIQSLTQAVSQNNSMVLQATQEQMSGIIRATSR